MHSRSLASKLASVSILSLMASAVALSAACSSPAAPPADSQQSASKNEKDPADDAQGDDDDDGATTPPPPATNDKTAGSCSSATTLEACDTCCRKKTPELNELISCYDKCPQDESGEPCAIDCDQKFEQACNGALKDACAQDEACWTQECKLPDQPGPDAEQM